MHREFVHAARAHVLTSVIVPNVGSMPAILAKLKIIDVRRGTILPDKYHFVLGTVKGTHARIALVPDAYVLQLGVMCIARGEHFPTCDASHAKSDESNRPSRIRKAFVGLGQEVDELVLAHFHRKP